MKNREIKILQMNSTLIEILKNQNQKYILL